MHCSTQQVNEIQMVAQSTAGPLCSFGIQLNDSSSITSDNSTSIVNEKKRIKLEKDLERLIRTVSNESYQKSASTSVQQKHREKVCNNETNDKIDVSPISISDRTPSIGIEKHPTNSAMLTSITNDLRFIYD